jgi:hypothetical protein
MLYFLFKLPAETLKEVVAVQTLEHTINSFRTFSGFLLFLLFVSLVANIILVLMLRKVSNQVEGMIQMIKNVDLMKEAVAKIATQVKRSSYKDDDSIDEYEIIKKGF